MSIKFVCSCGKHLRASDKMASQRAICPRCGSMVGVPSLTPTMPGAQAPMSPQERVRHARDREPLPTPYGVLPPEAIAAVPPVPVPDHRVRLLAGKGRRKEQQGRHLEKHWWQCLLYPWYARRLCFGLAFFLAIGSAIIAVLVPPMLADFFADPWDGVAARVAVAFGLVMFVGVPCGFFDSVLRSAVAGEVYYIVLGGNPILTILLPGIRWVGCFLIGPVVFLVVGLLYWFYCGDPSLVDRLILVELALLTAAFQIYAVLTFADRGSWLDINPVAVLDLAHRLGWRGLGLVMAAAGPLLLHGAVMVFSIVEVHRGSLILGWTLLLMTWASGVFWGTFFCRLLGIACHRSHVTLAQAEAEG